MSYRHRMFIENCPNKVALKLAILSASHNNESCFENFPKESVNNILYLTCERDRL